MGRRSGFLERLWVGTADGAGAVADWPGGRRPLAGRTVRALTADGDAWWAIADGRTLVRAPAMDAANPGAWQEVAARRGLRLHCMLPLAEGLLVGASEARLLRLPRDGDRLETVRSFDHAPGRAHWYTPWGAPADIRSLAAGRNGTWYVNVHVGGVVRSRDSGSGWEATLDIEADVHEVRAHPALDGGVAAATARGLAVSEDGGTRWRYRTAGLHAAYMRALAFTEDGILASASRGERGREAAVYRAPAGVDAPLVRCREGLPEWFDDNVNTGNLVAEGQDAALATPYGEVYASRDGGLHWRRIARGLPPVKCLALAPSTGSRPFAGTAFSSLQHQS